ncbi:MAG: BACON domain-containing protein, partial [Bacteroidales bacterium]|nr:BACON domain-containing protein [Bacteroidales bacterium]
MLEQQGSNLVVRAMENLVVEERVSYIFISAGGAAEKVMVKQSAADIVLEASPGEINVPNTGGQYFIDITSNSANWTIEKETAADWVIVKQFKGADIAELTVHPNETGEGRTLKLYAKSGSKLEEVVINQAGGASGFILPLLEAAPTQIEILAHEQANGSFLLSYSGPMPSWGYYDEAYEFAVNSPMFYSTTYDIADYRNGMITEVNMWSEKNAAMILSDEYIEFLEANGFAIEQTAAGFTGYNSESQFSITAITDLDADLGRVIFAPVLEQDQDYPTFDSFPFDRADWLNNSEWNSAAIVAEEESEGGTILSQDAEMIDVLVAEEFRPLYERLFFMENDLATEFLAVWDDANLGAWSPDGGNTWMLTNEFEALLEGAGFVFYMENQGNLFYYLAEKELMIVPRGARYTDVLDAAPVFSMNYFNYVESASVNMLDKDTRSKIGKELTKSLNRSNSKLNIIK